jgi:hypothetical protein
MKNKVYITFASIILTTVFACTKGSDIGDQVLHSSINSDMQQAAHNETVDNDLARVHNRSVRPYNTEEDARYLQRRNRAILY